MELNFKNNFWGYFRFYHSVVGRRLYFFILLNIIVGLLDGMGLTMFIPLLMFAFNKSAVGSTGKLRYLSDALRHIGISLNIVSVLVIIVLLFSLKGLIRFCQVRYMSQMRFIFITRVRTNLLEMLGNISFKGFLKLDSGRIQNSLLSETIRLYNTMAGYFASVQFAVMLFTYYILAFVANYKFATFVLIGGGLSNLLYKRIFSNTQKISADVSKKGDAFNSYLAQAINHFRYLKATDYFKKYVKKLHRVADETEKLNWKMGKYAATSEGMREPVAIFVICAIIYIQIRFFPGGNVNSIFVSLLLFYRSLTQLSFLQTTWQSFVQNIGSMEAVANITREMQSLTEKNNRHKAEVLFGTIELKNVGLKYDAADVLQNINIRIPKNKTIAFVGESGSGKTSLAHIIIGLMPPSGGELLINDIPLSELNIGSYRNKIGYISQDPVIFNDTVFNNISFFDEPTEENRQRFQHVVNLASLSQFVQSLPDKENSILGDNGILISGGQKQRISIARELYKQCELLVLDEATSALDSETEAAIKENIDKLKGNYTIIIIAHRLSTIKNADIIYLLKNKTISSFGSFSEMTETSDEFRKMTLAQMI